MNIAEAKKAIAERQCPNLDPRCHCHGVRRSDFQTVSELEKSVREKILPPEQICTDGDLGYNQALKKVLGEE